MVTHRRTRFNLSAADAGPEGSEMVGLLVAVGVDLAANAVDFRVMEASIEAPGSWTELIAHDPGRRITAVEPFAGAVEQLVRAEVAEGRGQRGGEIFGPLHLAHAHARAEVGGLDEHREAERGRCADGIVDLDVEIGITQRAAGQRRHGVTRRSTGDDENRDHRTADQGRPDVRQ